ncbi:MAG: hypothetical protein AAB728_03970 [Patescibacteria group bacterium]
MKLSNASIGRFKVLAKRELGLELSDAQAEEYANRVLALIRAIVESPPQRERGPP